MKLESVLRSVVFPEPVPPEMMMLRRAFIAPSMSASISGVNALNRSRSFLLSGLEPNMRIVTAAPSRASGGMMALKREPLGKRASTIGEVSSTRRPTRETMRSMIWSRCSLSRKTTSERWILPFFLDEDFLRPVDHDVGDLVILEEQFERAEAERFVENFADEALAFVAVEERVFGIAKMLDDASDFAAERIRVHLADAVHVEAVDKPHVDMAFESFVRLVRRIGFFGRFARLGGDGRRRRRGSLERGGLGGVRDGDGRRWWWDVDAGGRLRRLGQAWRRAGLGVGGRRVRVLIL